MKGFEVDAQHDEVLVLGEVTVLVAVDEHVQIPSVHHHEQNGAVYRSLGEKTLQGRVLLRDDAARDCVLRRGFRLHYDAIGRA